MGAFADMYGGTPNYSLAQATPTVEGGDVLGSIQRGGGIVLGLAGNLADVVNRFRTSNSSPLENPEIGNRPGGVGNRAAYAQGLNATGGGMSSSTLLLLAVVAGVAVLIAKKL